MLSPRGLRVSRCCPQFIPLAALGHRTLAEHTWSKSDGNRPRSTSIPRLAAFGCASSVEGGWSATRTLDPNSPCSTEATVQCLQASRGSRLGLHIPQARDAEVGWLVGPRSSAVQIGEHDQAARNLPMIEAATAPVQDHRARVPRSASCSHCEKHHLDRYGWTARGTSPSLDRAQQCPHTAAESACPSAAEHPRA